MPLFRAVLWLSSIFRTMSSSIKFRKAKLSWLVLGWFLASFLATGPLAGVTLAAAGYNSFPPPGGMIDLGSTAIGTQTNGSFIINNTGSPEALTVSFVSFTGVDPADFTVSAPAFPITIPAGGTPVIVTIRCIPSAPGVRMGRLNLASNDPVVPTPFYDLKCTGTVPVYGSTPVAPGGTINFGGVSVGTPGTFNLTVSNTGQGSLFVSGYSLSGPNTADFGITTTLPFTITPGQNRIVTFRCTPGDAGTRMATISFNTNDPANPNPTYSLTCNGIRAIFAGNPPPPGPIALSGPIGTPVNQTISVSNIGDPGSTLSVSGSVVGPFTVSGLPLTVPQGMPARNIVVGCTPTAIDQTGTLTLTTNDQTLGTVDYNLSCVSIRPIFNGTPAQPGPIVLGGPPGTPTSANISVVNVGDAGTTLNVSGSVSNPAFTVTGLPFSRTQGQPPAIITLTCTPTTTAQAGTLTLTTNDPGQPTVTYNLQCIGLSPTFSATPPAPGPINVNGTIGLPASRTIAVSNTGTAGSTLNVSGSVSNPAFTVTGLPMSVGQGSPPQDITIACTPTATTQSGTLTLTTNDTARPTVTYTLNCTGLTPTFSATPAAPGPLNFNGPIGTAINQTINVTNVGQVGSTLNVDGSVSNPAFTVTGLPLSVAQGAAASQIVVSCTPSSTTAQTGTLALTTNDPARPNVVYSLSCTGQSPVFTATPAIPGPLVLSGATGATVSTNVSVSNTGTAGTTLNVSFVSVSNPAFTVTGLPINVAQGAAAVNFTVSCLVSATTQTGTLMLTSNDPGRSTIGYNLSCSSTASPNAIYSATPAAPGPINLIAATGTSVATTVNVANAGTPGTTLTVSLASLSNSIFVVTGLPLSVGTGGAGATFGVRCIVGTTAQTGLLMLTTNDPTQPSITYNLNCNPTGTTGGFSSSPVTPGGTINFGAVAVGGTVGFDLTLLNTGSRAIQVNSATLTGFQAAEFRIASPTYPVSIPAGGQIVTRLECRPTASGSRTASLQLQTNDTTTPVANYSLVCTATGGTGGLGSVPVAPGSTIDLGSTSVGGTLTFELTLTNSGSGSVNINTGRFEGTAAVDFSFGSFAFPTTIGASSSKLITIRCRPSVEGERTATLILETSDPNLATARYTVRCFGVKQEQNSADLALTLEVNPDRIVSNDPTNLVSYNFKVKNRGFGTASFVVLRLPIDPNLEVGYSVFDEPSVWVQAIEADAVIIALPRLESGRVVIGTMVFRPRLKPITIPGTKVSTRYKVNYDDPSGVGIERFSNAVNFNFIQNGSNLTVGSQGLKPLLVNVPGGGQATFETTIFAPQENVSAWLTGPGENGPSKAIMAPSRAGDKGDYLLVVSSAGLKAGTYTVVVRGQRSGIVGTATLIVGIAQLTPALGAVKAGREFTFRATFLQSDETASVWLTYPDKHTSTDAIKTKERDSMGEYTIVIATDKLANGFYLVVVRGSLSGLEAVARLEVYEGVEATPAPVAAANTKPTVKAGGVPAAKPTVAANVPAAKPTVAGAKPAATVAIVKPTETAVPATATPKPTAIPVPTATPKPTQPIIPIITVEPVAVGLPSRPTIGPVVPIAPSAPEKIVSGAKLVISQSEVRLGSGTKVNVEAKFLSSREALSVWLVNRQSGKQTWLPASQAGANGDYFFVIDVDGLKLPAGDYVINVQGHTSNARSNISLKVLDK